MGLGQLNPAGFKVAGFVGIEDYAHFHDTDYPKCFACNSELMAVRPTLLPGAVVMPATMKLAGGPLVVVPGMHLVFPRLHVEEFMQLPANWTLTLQNSMRQLGIVPPYNVTMNLGHAAGQRFPHLHEWIIQRGIFAELLGKGLGLGSILVYLSQFGVVMPAAE